MDPIRSRGERKKAKEHFKIHVTPKLKRLLLGISPQINYKFSYPGGMPGITGGIPGIRGGTPGINGGMPINKNFNTKSHKY